MDDMEFIESYGNNKAKSMYEKVAFIQTDLVNTDDCYEVNLRYLVPEKGIIQEV